MPQKQPSLYSYGAGFEPRCPVTDGTRKCIQPHTRHVQAFVINDWGKSVTFPDIPRSRARR